MAMGDWMFPALHCFQAALRLAHLSGPLVEP
jgi:hypothetical protein